MIQLKAIKMRRGFAPTSNGSLTSLNTCAQSSRPCLGLLVVIICSSNNNQGGRRFPRPTIRSALRGRKLEALDHRSPASPAAVLLRVEPAPVKRVNRVIAATRPTAAVLTCPRCRRLGRRRLQLPPLPGVPMPRPPTTSLRMVILISIMCPTGQHLAVPRARCPAPTTTTARVRRPRIILTWLHCPLHRTTRHLMRSFNSQIIVTSSGPTASCPRRRRTLFLPARGTALARCRWPPQSLPLLHRSRLEENVRPMAQG